MSRWILMGLFLSLASVACGDSSETTPSSTEAAETESTETTSDEASDAVEADQAEEAAQTAEAAAIAAGAHDVAGLSVMANDDGSLQLSGPDKWGGRLDTTYASLEYLTNAVPVLKRSITEEQGTALEALVAELAAGEGAEGAEGDGSASDEASSAAPDEGSASE